MRVLLIGTVLFFASRVANAACVINGVRPTVALPTMDAGQQFSFLATADCEKLRFRVPGTTFVAIPKGGPDTGARLRTYRVVLTASEWNSLVDEDDTTFTWSIIGTTGAGVTTRVTTTNELKHEAVTMDLSGADAKLVAEDASSGIDWLGGISGAGDVDGDGHDDLLVGAENDDEGGSNAGAAYVVLGPVTGTLDLSLAADAKLVGEEAGDAAGHAVAGAGDVDGDGIDDLLVGAGANDEGGEWAGAAYVVLGPVTGTLDLSLADAKLIGGDDYYQAGYRVAGAGDMDGDGHDDLLVDGNAARGGAVLLVLGPVTGTLGLFFADATLVRAHSYVHGTGAGDVDADGHRDLLVGAPYRDEGGNEAGAAYLVRGPVTGTLDLSLADAKLLGEVAGDYAGIDVAGAGDVDSDGHDDLLIGAQGNGGGTGAAYVVLGPVTGTLDLSLADAKLVGETGGGWAGMDVSGAGDVDFDGHDDLLVGSCGEGRWAGAAYLALGPVTGTLALSFADAKLVGEEPNDWACFVSGAGDVDADGRADIMVGAPFTNGLDLTAYLVYGGGL